MKLISFQWSKWVLLEYSHSEDVSVDTVSSLSYLWYNTYTETHFRNLARTCKRSLFPVVRCPPVRFLSRHYLRWDNDIVYPWGKRFEMEREVLWLWDNLGGLLPRLQYSSCSHPLVSFVSLQCETGKYPWKELLRVSISEASLLNLALVGSLS